MISTAAPAGSAVTTLAPSQAWKLRAGSTQPAVPSRHASIAVRKSSSTRSRRCGCMASSAPPSGTVHSDSSSSTSWLRSAAGKLSAARSEPRRLANQP